MTSKTSPNLYINRDIIDRFWPLAALFLCTYIPVSFFVTHDYLSGWFQLADLAFLGLALLFYLRTKNAEVMSNALASMGIPVLLPWTITGGPAYVGLWWSVVYVVWVFFITSRRWAFFWLILYLGLTFAVIGLSLTGAFSIAYSFTQLLNLFFAFGFTASLAFFFNETTERYFNLSYTELAERRKIESELRRQAELFNVMPDAVLYGIRHKGKISLTSLNKAAEELFEINASQATGKALDDLLNAEIIGKSRQEVQSDLWDNKGYWRGDINFTTRTGKKIIALATVKTIKDERNDAVNWVGIYTDITILKKTQQRLEFALDVMIAGLWEWDIVNNVRWWSPRYFEILGYGPDDLLPSAEGLRKLLHPDDEPVLFGLIDEYLHKPERFETEIRYRLKNGLYHWFRVTGKTNFDSRGQPVIMAGSIIDIDEKHRSLDIIKQQALLMQMVPDAIILSSKSRKFVDLNPGAEQLFGLNRNEVIGKNVAEYISLAFAPGISFEEEFAGLWRTGFWRGETKITNLKNGKVANVLTNIKTLDNMEGGEPGYMAIYTDLGPLNMNKELKAANEYLEQLAFISAHDIKAPIHSIAGLTDVLMEYDNLTGEQISILQMQKDVVNQMEQTNKGLNDILQLRKGLVNGATFKGDLQPLKEILARVLAGLAADIETSSAKVELKLNGAASELFPAVYMKSIFHNLLINCIKYRDAQRPLLITVEATEAGGDSWMISVTDNGLGFDMNLFGNKLFGIFKRFHPEVPGTGIGLHIVKSIVDAFGGQITVHSQTGRGTTFEITFKKFTPHGS